MKASQSWCLNNRIYPSGICLITSANKPLHSLTTHRTSEFNFIFTLHIAIPGPTALPRGKIPSTAFTFLWNKTSPTSFEFRRPNNRGNLNSKILKSLKAVETNRKKKDITSSLVVVNPSKGTRSSNTDSMNNKAFGLSMAFQSFSPSRKFFKIWSSVSQLSSSRDSLLLLTK